MASPPSGTSLVGEMILLTESQAESSDSENSEATVFSSDPSETETRDTDLSDLMEYEDDYLDNDRSVPNIVSNLYNRELYGRFTKGPKFKTVRPFREIPERCRYAINDIFADSGGLFQILMGFTRCGRFFLTFEETHEVSLKTIYHLFIWRFIPGMKLELAQTIQIFNQFNGNYSLEQIMFMQYPNDYHKLVCVGIDKEAGQESLQISLVTLDGSLNCRHCSDPAPLPEELEHRGWCLKHGFAQHYFITLSLPAPIFDPLISLSYPGLLIIDSGHSIQILKVSTGPLGDDQGEFYSSTRAVSVTFDNPSDNQSVNSESLNEPETSAVEDISEYDSSEGNKPFHELNISCEPLNVTGRSYQNTLPILESRIKRLQNSPRDYVFMAPNTSTQKQPEKSIVVDKKIAEQTYEFTEDNEKYEKISLFRKKRLADKKYEFSEDNTENIVPFHILRRERRYLRRAQSRNIRSADLGPLFLSPRSPGWRSPMQSPSSRNSQFSPSGARHIYCTSVRPYYPKSPVSPRDYTRVNIYSQGLEENCSDFDSRLVLRNPIASSNLGLDSCNNQNRLILLDSGQDHPKWIKKTVRRYTNGDYENGSLLSGDSRDDYNNPLELPLYIEDFDQPPEDFDGSAQHLNDRQVVHSQLTFDYEQFVDNLSRVLCERDQLFFRNSQDYNIKITKVCPIKEEIQCAVYIKIGACRTEEPFEMVQQYCADCTCIWNFITNEFKVPCCDSRLIPAEEYKHPDITIDAPNYSRSGILILNYRLGHRSKLSITDSQHNFEIYRNHITGDNDSSFWLS
ncbi:unnamed protein product [Ceutorhynchus assimilis]|uniref:DDB1- and CUL4-associated factor 15 WD40 repeat-containing domain-containing protein n=1 Tax=Ceutorhynchus assimilis TaxID=467358 RepID=A0A9N9QDA4_9CUCU|nr:unnamed protein product [Ceutorhynchus assimilis]